MSTVVFTVTSNGYKFMTWNLWLHCKRIGVPWQLLIVCLDKESHRFFQTIANIPSVLLPSVDLQLRGDTTKVSSYGSGDFNRVTREKLSVYRWMLGKKEFTHYLYLDSDIVLFKDPMPYLQTILSPENYLCFQCDEHTEGEYTCRNYQGGCTNICTGVIAFYNDETTREKLLSMVGFNDTLWKTCNNDQEYIQKTVPLYSVPYKTLDRSLFPNGLFLGKSHWKTLEDKILLHFNFIVGGGNKQRIIKSNGFWLVPY
jgi:hypothetical protein